jgi:LEA14-like dessication related protein
VRSTAPLGILATALVVATLLLAGCVSIAPELRVPRTPSFQLVDLTLEPPRRGRAEAVTTLTVDNPNAWPVIVESVRYALVVNGTLVGEISLGTDLRVPQRSTRRLVLRMPHDDDPRLAALRERPLPRGIAYRVTGEAKVIGEGVDLVPIRIEGFKRTG